MAEPPRELPQVLVLHRYFAWCATMRNHYEAARQMADRSAPWHDVRSMPWFCYLSYWYTGLCLVMEGWRALELREPAVDALIDSPNRQLLRSYRAAVSRFRADWNDQRFNQLMTQATSKETIAWAQSLHDALSAYFHNWIARYAESQR